MKLNLLVEGPAKRFPHQTNMGHLRFKPEEIARAVAEAKKSSTFAELVKLVDFDESSKLQTSRGVMVFKVRATTPGANFIRSPIEIHPNGYVRASSGRDRPQIHGYEVEVFPNDAVKSYENMLKKVLKYVTDGAKRQAQSGKRSSDLTNQLVRLAELADIANKRSGTLTDREDIMDLLTIFNIPKGEIRINDDSSVIVHGDLNFYHRDYAGKFFPKLTHKILPIRVREVTGDFSAPYKLDTKTLENFPSNVGGDYRMPDNIPKLEGKIECGQQLNISCTSLANIHKLVKAKQIFIRDPGNVKDSILGLFYFDDVAIEAGVNGQAKRAFSIFKQHFPQGKAGMLSCQTDLLEAGLEEYAQL